VAEEFDAIHSVQRALRVGSVDRIIPPVQLRPYLIDAVERGMLREMELIIRVRHRHRDEAVKHVPIRRSGNGVPSRIGTSLAVD
jgi:hypothetical protein